MEYTRTCSPLDSKECVNTTSSHYSKIITCNCKTDACNGAGKTTVTAALGIVLALATLISVY
jgi:hypothetical protein